MDLLYEYSDIPDSATAPGLDEARQRLKLDRMTKEELNAYYRHLNNIVILRDNIYTERAEGRAEGRMEEKREMVHNMKSLNIPLDTISQVTGLSIEEIKSL